MWKKVFCGWIGVFLLVSASAGAEPKAIDTAGYQSMPVMQEEVAQQGETQGNVPSELAGSEYMPANTEQPVPPPAQETPVAPPVDIPAPDPVVEEQVEPYVAEPVSVEPEMTEEEMEQAILDSRKIKINLANCSLSLYEGDKKVRLYPIAVGKPSTPTPIGYYEICSKDVNPTWIDPTDPEFAVPSGEANPLGYRWMEIQGNYGIHGTNRPDSIGNYVSNGCIRMFEDDVEILFDMVQIGTPVEITYNRIVVEKTPDDVVVYYIYPDNYDRQAVDVGLVNEWLSGYGIQAFEPNSAIEEKIYASDGEPTYIGKVYSILLNGQKLAAKAVVKDNVIYLPAMEIAKAANINLGWDAARSMLVSTYGEVPGFDKKDYLYLDAANVKQLFHLKGTLRSDKFYALETDKEPVPVRPSSQPQPKPEPTQPTTEPTKPTTDPTKPTTEPTKPTTEPTKPTTEPTKPTTEPAKPTTEPTQPASEPRPWQRDVQQPSATDGRTAGGSEASSTENVTGQRELPAPSSERRPILRRVNLEGEEE